MSRSPTKLPHTRCNWLLEGILVGAAPTPETLPDLLDVGEITVFVNTASDSEWDYSRVLPTSVTYIHFPIASGRSPSLTNAKALIETLLGLHSEGKSIYIHCNGGHGRTGLIGACLFGTITKVKAAEAIRTVESSRATRLDPSRNFIPTPETTAQVTFVGKYLGVDEPLPDRSDRTWLVRVKKERAKASSSTSLTPTTDSEIRFYTGDKAYPEFSNYFVHNGPLDFEGRSYASAEHIFQAAKFLYPEASADSIRYGEIVAGAQTPNIARELATQKIRGGFPWRTKLNPTIAEYLALGVAIRSDWDQIRDQIMKAILRVKFTVDKRCHDALLNTHDRVLIEHTTRDNYWGNGGDDSGQNRLGMLLMEVRNELAT